MGRHLPQLDGLRTVAVLLVIGTHTGFIPGGYLGVDVFFVLSGYLITTVLLREHAAGRWSIKRFYIRRARRLYPALLLMLAITLPFGQLLGGNLRHYVVVEAVAGAYLSDFFVAHSLVWMGGLVHTWSLAIEEQFYLFWPLALWALLRSRRRSVWFVLPVVTAAMFYALVSASNLSVLYLPWTRGCGLLFGCLLALGLRRRELRYPTAVTVASAVALAVVIHEALPHEISAGLAVLASTGLIAGLVHGGPIARLLSARPMVWLGERSYGIYLWHVPILYALPGTIWAPHTIVALPVTVFGSVTLAALSYRFFESRFRRRSEASQHAIATNRHRDHVVDLPIPGHVLGADAIESTT